MTYYLVQRLTSKKTPSERDLGFDRHFQLEYMGSSEFEWGAIPAALKEMRSKPVVVEPHEVTIDGVTRTVYFVGHRKALSMASDEMEFWSKSDGRRPAFWGKESTGFPQAFRDEPDKWRHTDAWWAIAENIAFALTPELAERLATAYNTKPEGKK